VTLSQKTATPVALLVDGDNVSAIFAGQILREASALGPLKVRRAYGNANGIAGWEQAPSFRVMHAGRGKNGADLLLAIDAMELALTGVVQAFAIATSDGDFSHLAHRLREVGRHVLGLGEDGKVSDHFHKACDEFIYLKRPAPPPGDDGLSPLERNIMAVIREMDTSGNGALVTSLNARMRQKHNVKISEEPERTWAAYFAKRASLYELVGGGTEKRVRIVLSDVES